MLTDFHFQQRYSHAELARQAIAGGADTIQFRQKTGEIRAVLHEAELAARVCRDAGVPLLVDDRVDLTLAIDAEGVHLGQLDLPVAIARKVLGPEAVIGATATTVRHALRAQDEGADYIGFGPVFETRSKANPASVKGLEGLAEVCAAVSIPVIAIAGITVERVRPVMEAGAYGFAVMSAVTTAPSPTEAAAAFRLELEQFAVGRGAVKA
ncbi:MAG TPA: thiamine phosphate synthase [Rhodothermales bacterium]|nr:thiamine phosphate synthase [Rhodothermales bacterium]